MVEKQISLIVLLNIIEQAINSKKIVRFSDGEEVKKYIFIEDAMEICANL